jgi:DNA-binding LytR/AlgR family response regulator
VIRVLLADDEPIALQRLELALACIPEVRLVASAKNGREASLLIRELQPDIAILDIQMPGKDGFAVVEDFRNGSHVPEVIFITAFREHALHAFEVHAVDYLLKPVAFDRLRDAIGRATLRVESRTSDQRFAELQAIISSLQSENDSPTIGHERELWVPTRNGLLRIPVESIDMICAEGDYVSVHANGSSHLLRDTISSLELRLSRELFMRIHRSTIINISKLKRIGRRIPRGYVAVLSNDMSTDVGPSYIDRVLTAVNAKRWRG